MAPGDHVPGFVIHWPVPGHPRAGNRVKRNP
jgi:hypothetical protein